MAKQNKTGKGGKPSPIDGLKANDDKMPLTTHNYVLMLIGFALIVVGFVLMLGGASENPAEEFNYNMFSFRRITLAPILVLAGFVFEIYAIMARKKKQDDK